MLAAAICLKHGCRHSGWNVNVNDLALCSLQVLVRGLCPGPNSSACPCVLSSPPLNPWSSSTHQAPWGLFSCYSLSESEDTKPVPHERVAGLSASCCCQTWNTLREALPSPCWGARIHQLRTEICYENSADCPCWLSHPTEEVSCCLPRWKINLFFLPQASKSSTH